MHGRAVLKKAIIIKKQGPAHHAAMLLSADSGEGLASSHQRSDATRRAREHALEEGW